MTPAHAFPVVSRLRELARTRPVVTAHRGDSRNFPENTLPAFASAVAMGAKMQEFDVQQTSCGALVCLHDLTLDRTTDAAKALGPGARIPTLEQALAVMLPNSIPMIEHKGGDAKAYVDLLRRCGAAEHVLVQSFDWEFVARVRSLANDIALGLLGPTDAHAQLDDSAIAAALRIGASFVHWHATELTRDAIDRAHAAGLLVVTYTSDDELSWHGGRALGVDAMCTNDPRRMLRSLA